MTHVMDWVLIGIRASQTCCVLWRICLPLSLRGFLYGLDVLIVEGTH